MHILNKNYNKEYVQIYIWRTLSLVSSFASLLIVIPHISDNKELFGIYSFCISLSLYLSYADIGFLGSGQKYAAEEYAKGNRTAEIKILGFTAFILIVMVIPFTIAMIFLSFNPHLIIDELSSEGVMIASKLFLILGIITPIEILLTRVMQSILIIRIKDYISLRIQIIFNLISILSVLYFFAGDKYQIVEYFLFKSVMALIGSIVIICLIKKIESYDYTKLLKSIKFNKAFYQKSKKLAGSSALLTVSWVIFYELDIVIIGKIFGAEEVAIYAIAFTFLNFLRNIWNIIYSPYSQRFNHLSVESTSNKLKKLASQIIDYTFPLCIITTITLIISSDYFIKLWVGQTYSSSIILMQILIISSFYGFINKPAQYYFTAKTKYSYMNLLAVVQPIVFILCLFLLVPQFKLIGFAASKALAIFAGIIISYVGLKELLSPLSIIKNWILPASLIICLIIYLLPIVLQNIFPSPDKNSLDLALLILILATTIVISYIGVLLIDRDKRIDLASIIRTKFMKSL